MEQNPLLNYQPESTNNSTNPTASLAEAIKAKYPAPKPGSRPSIGGVGANPVESDPFDAPILGLGGGDNHPKVSFTEKSVHHSEIYNQLSDGSFEARFDNYIQGTNNQERLAQEQTNGEQWTNGSLKFLGKIGTAVLGGTVGSVVGFKELVTTGSLEAMYNNDFNKWLDTLNEKMDYRLPNYYTQQEQSEGFFGSLDNANFWANDLLGGLSFTIGTIVSEAIWSAATGGVSIIGSLARAGARLGVGGFKTAAQMARANSMAAKVGKDLLRSGQFSGKQARMLGQTAEGLNTARFTYTSAGYEAGVEARSYMKEAEETYLRQFEEQNGRQPTSEEWASFRVDLQDSANAVFATNGVLVGATNLSVYGRMVDIPNPFTGITNSMNKSMFGIGHKVTTKEGRKILQELTPTKFQKFAGKTYSVMRAPVIEGVWEEGMQAVTSNGAENWLLSRYDSDATEEALSMIEAAYEGMSHTYGTKEGWKEVGLGMLIGLIGGGIATGGKFNDVSNARKDYKSKLDHLNTFSAENTLETFRVSNQINKAVKDADKAASKNDLLGKDMATKRILYTNARANERFGRKDAAEDFRAAMEGLDDSYFEAIGLDPSSDTFSEEKDNLKKDLYNQYKEVQDSYKTNKKTAEYLVARGGLVGVENTEDLVEAVAYNITMGENAHDFRDKAFKIIDEEMVGEMATKVKNGVKYQTTLANAHKRTRERFYYHRKKAKKADRDLENALERLKQFENMSRETNTDIDLKIRKAQAEVEKFTKRSLEEKGKMNEIFGMAQAEEMYQNKVEGLEVVNENDLLEIDENLDKGREYLERIKETNPTKYQMLNKMFDEYHRANYAFKQFNDTVQGLANDSLKLQEYNDFLTKKIYKGKKNNEFTQAWIDNNLKAYQQGTTEVSQNFVGAQAVGQAQLREAIEDKLYNGEELTAEEKELYELFKEETDRKVKARQIAEKMINQGFIEGDDLTFYNENKDLVDEFVNKQEKGNGIKPPATKVQKPKTLKERITNAINEDTAVQAYVGENFDEVEAKKPTIEEAKEFETLLERKRKSATGRGKRPDPNVEPLNEEEQARYDELEEKLSNWRIVDGSIDPDGYSIHDMFVALDQQRQTPDGDNTKATLSEEEIVEVKIVGDEDGTKTVDIVDFIQTYENVKVKVNKNTKSFVFSHLNIGTILSKFAPGQIKIKSPRGKNYKDFSRVELNKHGKKEGTKFQITLSDGSKITATINEKGRIAIPTEEFPKIQGTLGMKLVNTNLTKNSYFDVYKEVTINGEKTFVPMASEFKLETVDGSSETLLQPSEIEKLDKDDELTFKVNMKSSFNNDLADRLNKEGIKEKEREEVIKEIEDNLEIYVMTNDGRVVGVVKAAPTNMAKNSKSQDGHRALRQLAAQKFIEQAGTALATPIDLGAVVPVSKVLTGTPSLQLKETAEGLTPVNTDFTDKALEEVEDFGFVDGGQIKTNGNTDLKDVMTGALKNLGKGHKVPFVIFKHGNKKIAYPISLKVKSNTEAIEEIAEINNTRTLGASEKIIAINEVLLRNGLSPNKYKLMNATSKEIDGIIDNIVEDLFKMERAPDLNRWLRANKSILKDEASISIDLTNRPIKSPKLAVNFGAIIMPGVPSQTSTGATVSVPNQNQVNNIIKNC